MDIFFIIYGDDYESMDVLEQTFNSIEDIYDMLKKTDFREKYLDHRDYINIYKISGKKLKLVKENVRLVTFNIDPELF